MHQGSTPLHEAALAGSVDVIRLLVNHSADVTVRNKSGKTARDVAAEAARHAVAELLQELEASRPTR
jgi:ankyrin repeat protein